MKRSDCFVSYDHANQRLVYVGSDPDERHWDAQWMSRLGPESVRRTDPFVVAQTKKVLSGGARVLDAGCGMAHTVWGLKNAGFEAYGVDYAPETVATVNRLAPELEIVEADVRKLPFDGAFFDGVWSLGVIEHFPAGFSDITREMWRVLRPGGYAFVTVPAMSPLRRMKALLCLYPEFDGNLTKFYQFVLQEKQIIAAFESEGWRYDGGCSRGGFKGLKDEAGPLLPTLQKIYESPAKASRVLRAGLNRMLAPVSFHTRFFRFQKPQGQGEGRGVTDYKAA